jgi:uncharacterized protein YbjT (DUF2867 family)
VVRDERKGSEWKQRGCEVAIADINDAPALAAAFAGTEGVFILVPPSFDPAPGFPEAHAIAASVRAALESTSPPRIVYLSTIGAQAEPSNLLTQHGIIENALLDLPLPITFLRPAWFMENCAWDVVPARDNGIVPSFLQPLEKPVPMVATADIARVAGKLDRQPRAGTRRTAQSNAERNRSHVRGFAPAAREGGSCSPGNLGIAVPIAGHEEPSATHRDAQRIQ